MSISSTTKKQPPPPTRRWPPRCKSTPCSGLPGGLHQSAPQPHGGALLSQPLGAVGWLPTPLPTLSGDIARTTREGGRERKVVGGAGRTSGDRESSRMCPCCGGASTVHPSAPGSVHLTFHRHNTDTCDSSLDRLPWWRRLPLPFAPARPSRVVRAISPLRVGRGVGSHPTGPSGCESKTPPWGWGVLWCTPPGNPDCRP